MVMDGTLLISSQNSLDITQILVPKILKLNVIRLLFSLNVVIKDYLRLSLKTMVIA